MNNNNNNNKMRKNERLGETNISKEQYIMKIVEYKNNKNVVIEFQDKHKTKVLTTYQNFKDGLIKNPYHKSVYGVGYIGEGKYTAKGKDGKHTKVYMIWKNMLQRCYDAYWINEHLTYVDCYVCDKWHNFQNFAEWFYNNIYNCNNERMELDKDILCKGNKMYSPETCVFVPKRINILFAKSDQARGKYPIGVSYDKEREKLLVQCNVLDENGKRKRKHLGRFPLNKPFQAFYTYKQFKENHIKQVAEEYKNLIPNKLYEALYKYEVEIND